MSAVHNSHTYEYGLLVNFTRTSSFCAGCVLGRQLSDLIRQCSAINLMGDLMDDQSLIGNGKTVSGQVPKLIRDQFDRPSNVHGKTGPK